MRPYICFFILVHLLIRCQQHESAWVEREGYVVIEAENALEGLSKESNWVQNDSIPGYSGAGYVTWRGEAMVGHQNESVPYADMPTDRKLVYQVQIHTPGVYFWRVRNLHFMEDGDNDCFVSINKSPFGKTYDWNEREFSFDETGSWAKDTLQAGIVQVEVAGRSHNFAIDRIVLFHESLAPEHWGEKGPYPWMEEQVWSQAAESARE